MKALDKALTSTQDTVERETIEPSRLSLIARVPAHAPPAAHGYAIVPQLKREKRAKGAAA